MQKKNELKRTLYNINHNLIYKLNYMSYIKIK